MKPTFVIFLIVISYLRSAFVHIEMIPQQLRSIIGSTPTEPTNRAQLFHMKLHQRGPLDGLHMCFYHSFTTGNNQTTDMWNKITVLMTGTEPAFGIESHCRLSLNFNILTANGAANCPSIITWTEPKIIAVTAPVFPSRRSPKCPPWHDSQFPHRSFAFMIKHEVSDKSNSKCPIKVIFPPWWMKLYACFQKFAMRQVRVYV